MYSVFWSHPTYGFVWGLSAALISSKLWPLIKWSLVVGFGIESHPFVVVYEPSGTAIPNMITAAETKNPIMSANNFLLFIG
jgi:hypothetical protein